MGRKRGQRQDQKEVLTPEQAAALAKFRQAIEDLTAAMEQFKRDTLDRLAQAAGVKDEEAEETDDHPGVLKLTR